MKNLRNLLILLTFFISSQMLAQVELKVGPLGLLFESPDISGEYLFNDDFSLEATLGLDLGDFDSSFGRYDRRGFSTLLELKYFFKTREGADRFYTSFYAGPEYIKLDDDFETLNGTLFTAGMMLGYKWVGKRNVIFEAALGGGRNYGSLQSEGRNFDSELRRPVDFRWKLAIGYRFNNKTS